MRKDRVGRVTVSDNRFDCPIFSWIPAFAGDDDGCGVMVENMSP